MHPEATPRLTYLVDDHAAVGEGKDIGCIIVHLELTLHDQHTEDIGLRVKLGAKLLLDLGALAQHVVAHKLLRHRGELGIRKERARHLEDLKIRLQLADELLGVLPEVVSAMSCPPLPSLLGDVAADEVEFAWCHPLRDDEERQGNCVVGWDAVRHDGRHDESGGVTLGCLGSGITD